MNRELSRLVWLYEARGCSQADISRRFQDEINRLLHQNVLLGRQISGLEHRPSKFIIAFDKAIDAALNLKYGDKFKEPLVEIEKAQDALENIQLFLDAYQEYQTAKDACRIVDELAGADYLRQLISVRNLIDLLVECDKLFREGKYRQAQLLSLKCRRRAEILQRVEKVAGQKPIRLLTRVAQSLDICNRSEMFILNLISDSAIREGLKRLKDLIREGYFALAEKLLDEIEIEIAPRQTLNDEYRRYQDIFEEKKRADRISPDVLRSIVAMESWHAAVDYLLENSLTAVSSEIGAIGRSPMPERSASDVERSGQAGRASSFTDDFQMEE